METHKGGEAFVHARLQFDGNLAKMLLHIINLLLSKGIMLGFVYTHSLINLEIT